jgi:hypothetical protein
VRDTNGRRPDLHRGGAGTRTLGHPLRARTGTTDIPVGVGGGFDGEVGLLSATGSFAGEITIKATTADGSTMTGTLTFE